MFETPVVIGLLLSLGTYLVGITYWLNNQFNKIRQLVYDQSELTKKLLLEKIEYHERHDDVRFNELNNNIWELRLRNAAAERVQQQDNKNK